MPSNANGPKPKKKSSAKEAVKKAIGRKRNKSVQLAYNRDEVFVPKTDKEIIQRVTPVVLKEKSKYGKKKIDIKKIRDDGTRRVCLNKRMRGIIKKQIEISVLCGIEYLSYARDPYTGNIFIYTNLMQPQNFLDDVLIQSAHNVSHIRNFTPDSYSDGIGDLHKIPVEGIMLRNKSGRPRKYAIAEDNSDLDEEPADDDGIVERATVRLMNNLKKEKYDTTNMMDEDRVYVPKRGLSPIKREPYAKQNKKGIPSGECRRSNRTRATDKRVPTKPIQQEIVIEFSSTAATPPIPHIQEDEIPQLLEEPTTKEQVWERLKEASANISIVGDYMKEKWCRNNIKVECIKTEPRMEDILTDPVLSREFSEIADMLNLNYHESEQFSISNYPWLETLDM